MPAANLFDYLSVFPPQALSENSIQFNTPCPWCTSGDGDEYEYLGHRFYGTDRLVWFKKGETPRAYCRHCALENRGRHGKGVYFLEDFQEKFGIEIEVDPNRPAFTYDVDDETQLPNLINPVRRGVFHSQCDFGFWNSLGFTDETIRHFALGWGRLYSSWGRGHLIPMQVRTASRELLDGDYYEARIPNEAGKFDKKNSTGGKKHIFWHVHDDPDSSEVLITESPKTAMAAWQLGVKNFAVTFGAGVWKEVAENYKFLRDFGYKTVIAAGDNDHAGELFNAMIIEGALDVGLKTKFIAWPDGLPEGYDIADALRDTGTTLASAFLRENTHDFLAAAPEPEGAAFIPDFSTVDASYTPKRVTPISIEEVRGDGVRSLQYAIADFLKEYRKKRVYGKGTLLLLAVRPGAGKTYSLIQAAEKLARERLVTRFNELHQLEEDIVRTRQELAEETDEDTRTLLQETLERLEEMHKEFSFQSVFWGAQYRDAAANLIDTGADVTLWFDFQARSEENCENFRFVGKLAAQGHNIMKFCEESCPFAARCRQRGYLSQYDQRRQYPIGIHRHEHLVVDSAVKGYPDLVVIDESPLRIVEAAVVSLPDEVQPWSTTWENDVDGNVAEAVYLFTDALSQTIRYNANEQSRRPDGDANPNYIISGSAFLRLLDLMIRQRSKDGWTLEAVMSMLDEKLIRRVQPNYIGEEESEIHPIRLPHIFKVIERELEAYVEDPDNMLPTCLHLVGGRLEVYPMERIKISSNTPIVVADATALMPELYEAAFGRDIEIYAPEVYNPNTEVTAVHGSDWTISNIEKHLGKYLRGRVKEIRNTDGEVFSMARLWDDSTVEQNRLVKSYMDAIVSYAMKHKKGGLLVVVHKRIRSIIEPMARKQLPQHKLAFGHYGALRGSNAYKDFEAVLLIGTPRIPYDVLWRKIQAWANLRGITEDIPLELSYVATPYDGTESGHTHISFTHPFAQQYVNQVELGEAVQSQERIRPHSGHEKKYIYLLSSRPIGMQHTAIEKKSKLLKSADKRAKIEAIAEYVVDKITGNEDFPSKREVMKAFRCSLETCNEGFELAEDTLNELQTA